MEPFGAEIQRQCGQCRMLTPDVIEWPSLELSVCSACHLRLLGDGLEPDPWCLRTDMDPEVCEGPVTYRRSVFGNGSVIAECRAHEELSEGFHRALQRSWPDSDPPPSRFEDRFED